MAYSSIPAAKAQILATLQAVSGLEDVHIEWGVPDQPHPNREAIYIGDARNVKRDWAAIGQLRIDESYQLHLLIEVHREGDDEQATEERMWEIVALTERAIVADVTLAGILAGPGHAKPGQLEPRSVPFDPGWHAMVALALDVKARISVV